MEKDIRFIFPKKAMYAECFKPDGVKLYDEYSCLQQNRLTRLIFKFLYKRIKVKEKLYNKELKDCGKATILAFDTVDYGLIEWIRNNNPQNRIIIFFINTVWNKESVNVLKSLGCELWSFDKKDCEKYGMKFNNWYCSYKKKAVSNVKKKYDVVFIGREKTRRPLLNKLAAFFDMNNIKYYFRVTHERNIPVFFSKKYKNQISYRKMIEIERKSKAMIEIIEPGQNGSTLRVMDSIFNEVKLITNFKPILESELYNKNNIFLLDENNMADLPDFLNKPFIKYPDEILKKYSFEKWISQFEIE